MALTTALGISPIPAQLAGCRETTPCCLCIALRFVPRRRRCKRRKLALARAEPHHACLGPDKDPRTYVPSVDLPYYKYGPQHLDGRPYEQPIEHLVESCTAAGRRSTSISIGIKGQVPPPSTNRRHHWSVPLLCLHCRHRSHLPGPQAATSDPDLPQGP